MAIKRSTKNQKKATSFAKFPANSDLPARLQKISEQTGLPFNELLQKWILQEESLIGIIQRGRGQAPESAGKRSASSRKTAVALEKSAELPPHSSPEYRKMLLNKARQLKKNGMTLKKIADTFNEENVSTVSGSGKWYSSSIANLLSSK